MLTLIVNATTTKYLLAALGMSDISHATRVTMAQGILPLTPSLSHVCECVCVLCVCVCVCVSAVRRVREAKHRAISMLKSDHFLADANWEMVEKTTEIENPYKHLAESVPVSVCVCVC